MTLTQVIIDVVVLAVVVAAILFVLYLIVGWARRRAKRAYVIAAGLAPLMALGHVVDPEYRIVHEAKQHKKREEDEPGDPPSDESDDGDVAPDPAEPPQRPTSGGKFTRLFAPLVRARNRATSA
jgi:hypothetical protein